MNLDRLETACVAATRPLRRVYRYVTGDPTCLGFVRITCLAVVLFDIVAGIAFYRDGDLKAAGAGLAAGIVIMVLAGPGVFRQAAFTDRSPIGPVVPDMIPRLGLIVTALLIFSSILQPFYSSAGAVLSALGSLSFLHVMWAAGDRDGGKGDRTLTKDLRRLLHRPGPEAAGGTVTREPIPVRAHR